MEHDFAETGILSYLLIALLSLALLAALWRTGFLVRLLKLAEEMLLSNWQLALLGTTAVALSLASGYTTFDGLRNFTSAPLLSVLVAFGIQGVMLIVSWLIGESFAAGMGRLPPPGAPASRRGMATGLALGAALASLAFYWALTWHGAIVFGNGSGAAPGLHVDWQRFADVALYFLMALTLIGLAIAFPGGDIIQPYVQSLRLIARNAVLWVMLLSSMSCSVFFSFDSHFNAIFPAAQRKHAAEIRTLNQIAGVISDTGDLARKVLMAEAGRLFESEGWKAYDAQLTRLALLARSAEAEIEAFLTGRMEQRQRGIGEQQERVAGAERGRSALLRKRDELESELQRLETSIGTLEADLAKAQAATDETRQAIAARRIDASAEEEGVEGTLKRGRGPAWRQRAAEIDELQRKLAIADEPRLKDAQRQRDLASARIVSLKREIATIIGEAAKYTGTIRAAGQQLAAADAAEGTTETGRNDLPHALKALETARTAFRQRPEAERLLALQRQCASLAGVVSATPATRERASGIDCDPASAVEAAARVLALNAGLAVFQGSCAGGDKLPQAATTDALLVFGRKCVQDSGLSSGEAAGLGARLQAIEMNRDDKAHRFVVTWNAILDGNRLATMALVLAIGIDGLVFVAGLFGAAAMRSPLSDLPSPKARSAEQLEAVVRSALGEDRLEGAELVLAAMKPAPGTADDRSEIDLTGIDGEMAKRIRRVLVAGRSIGAVERTSVGERYLIRPELIEYLSAAADAARKADGERLKRERQSGSASAPAVARNGRSIASPADAAVQLTAFSVDAAPTLIGNTRGGAIVTQDQSEEPDGDLAPQLHKALMAALESEATAIARELGSHAAEELHSFGAVLAGIERSGKAALDRAMRDLQREHAWDERAQLILQAVHREIADLLPVPMLLPELGVIDALIEKVDELGEERLLNRLRRFKGEIDAMDRSDRGAWRHIARQIRQLTEWRPLAAS